MGIRNGGGARRGGPRFTLGRVVPVALLIPAALATGCVSTRVLDRKATDDFRAGRYEEAAVRLEEGVRRQGENGRDLLLYLLDLGLALHQAGKYEESIQVFLRADKIAEIKDYTSLSTEAGSMLVGDNLRDYKGEEFENVLISTYLALNYALTGEFEDALVEARRVNRKLELMIQEGKRKYQQNAFARYLSAILYEADGNYNSAYVDYKKTLELWPDLPGLPSDLWRLATWLRMDDEAERWEREFSLNREEERKQARLRGRRSGQGEIIVIYQNGISPQKVPNPNFRTLPVFRPRPNPVYTAEVEIDGAMKGRTSPLYDIEQVAIQNLEEKYGGMIARKMAGIVAKEVVADQIGKRAGEGWGALAKIVMYASDQADLRSWSLLPKDLQIARYVVDPGNHTVRVLPVGAAALPEKTVNVAKGKKVFVTFRYVP